MTHFQDIYSQLNHAIKTRTYFSVFSEMPSPKIYGETAKDSAWQRFNSLKNQPFIIPNHPHNGQFVSSEDSPYGDKLGITYPKADVQAMINASNRARTVWANSEPEQRAEILWDIVRTLNQYSFDLAFAVKETTGQGFMMAFQAGGPHAQERALEAIIYGYNALKETPKSAQWQKNMGKMPPLDVTKKYKAVPRGIGLVIAPVTFPTWNSYSALFANLITGNSVIVKPHPMAVLPLALTVKIAREIFKQNGFDENIILLAVDQLGHEVTKDYINHDDVKIIDYTGSHEFAHYIRQNAPHKLIYTEESGVNTMTITGSHDFLAMCDNIAFSLALYSGQMCTAPQNIYIPIDGIETNLGHKSYSDIVQSLIDALNNLLADKAKSLEICGAIAHQNTLKRALEVIKYGKVLRHGENLLGDKGRSLTPYLIELPPDSPFEQHECFGPFTFIIPGASAQSAIDRASAISQSAGSITAGLYAHDSAMIDYALAQFESSCVHLSINLVGALYVNQSAAYSDYHVSGANPAGNACLTDSAYIANRFRIFAHRYMNPAVYTHDTEKV